MNHSTRVEALPMPEPAACHAHWQDGQAQRGPAVAICTYTARQGAPLESPAVVPLRRGERRRPALSPLTLANPSAQAG